MPDNPVAFARELDQRMKGCLSCQVTPGHASRETCDADGAVVIGFFETGGKSPVISVCWEHARKLLTELAALLEPVSGEGR